MDRTILGFSRNRIASIFLLFSYIFGSFDSGKLIITMNQQIHRNLVESIRKEVESHSKIWECDRELIIVFHSFKYDEYFAVSGDDESELDDLIYQFMGDLECPTNFPWLQSATCSEISLDEEDEILFLNSKYEIQDDGVVIWKIV
jgi:Mg2+ and Co2+ transporter CorA